MKRLCYVALLLFTVGCTRIQPGYVGIKVNASGSNRGVPDYPIMTGRVWYNPATATVLEWPTFVQNTSWTANVNEGHPVNEEITFTNADQMTVSADISIGYSLLADKVPTFYVKFRTDDMDAFTHGFLRNLTREQFDDIGGKYKIEQIMGDNAEFLAEVRKAVQDKIAPFGVTLEQFGLIGAPRPPQVIDAINAKVHAVQLSQQKENELRQAEADAKKVIAKAEGDARATEVWSKAQAEANARMAGSLTPNLVELKMLEKWDGKLPTYSGAVNPFITVK